jgi:dTDP-D-glucose 4,6-dehydratase
LSIAKARDKLGWHSKTSFTDGIAQTIAWWRSNAELIKRAVPAGSPTAGRVI